LPLPDGAEIRSRRRLLLRSRALVVVAPLRRDGRGAKRMTWPSAKWRRALSRPATWTDRRSRASVWLSAKGPDLAINICRYALSIQWI